ncbi:SLATT domain-containing protein [Arthrobacter pascens]|uniref:SLATT domain-containing protein n=1 Tax=Arthrobacter pascens TaxID=1677 RepID=UPI00196AA1DA|nr:SLATT domain-containing protein [Arthrobacter pascens]MBN3496380.1 DUF4231 domain-containing protein [Arthrobacter pascens]
MKPASGARVPDRGKPTDGGTPPEPFWVKAEWREVLPDTVLAHHAFRLRGKQSCERWWRYQHIALLVITASIPVVAAANGPLVVLAALGAMATFLAGVGDLFNWRDNFIRENRSLMQIQRELVLWKAGRPPYRSLKVAPADSIPEDTAELLVRVEEIVQTEGEGWATSVAHADDERID